MDMMFVFLFVCIYYYFGLFETGSPCSVSWPGTHYIDLAGLELTEICLSLPPKCWD